MICCPCESDDIASEGKNAGSTSHYEYLHLVWSNAFRASRVLLVMEVEGIYIHKPDTGSTSQGRLAVQLNS